MDTLDLVQNVRDGRDVKAAQEELYRRVRESVYPRLHSRIPERVKARLDTEDVLHDAFLRAMGALDLFEARSEGAFFAWIYSIAKNLVIDTSRRRSVENVRFVKGEGERGPRVSQLDGGRRRPESLIQGAEWAETVLSRLKDKEADVLRMRHFDDLSFAEIAERWDSNAGAVQRFYSRARAKFRELVETDSASDE